MVRSKVTPEKSQAPNPKLQKNPKSQIAKVEFLIPRFGICNLGFFGIWTLGFGISPELRALLQLFDIKGSVRRDPILANFSGAVVLAHALVFLNFEQNDLADRIISRGNHLAFFILLFDWP